MILTRVIPDNQLAEQRVIKGRHLIAREQHGIEAWPGPPGTLRLSTVPGAGAKFFAGSSALMRTSIA